jgi:SAM-dependent methyltransferase
MGIDDLVSVIVTGEGGNDAVASVLRQTHARLEVVVIRDAADLDPAAAADARVRTLTGGHVRAAARNTGLRATTGRFVVFLDAAERLVPSAVADSLEVYRADPDAAFVWGKCIVTREYHEDPEFPQQVFLTADHYAAFLARNHLLTPAVALFRRDPLEGIGGFDAELASLEDYDVYLKLLAQGRARCHTAVVAESPATDPFATATTAPLAELRRVLERQRDTVSADPHLEYAHTAATRIWEHRLGLAQGSLSGPDVGSTPTGIPSAVPRPGSVDFGSFRRVTPLSTNFGYERGKPIDRHYIESFLGEHAADITGRVLEVQENVYTHRFGAGRVAQADVLSLLADNPRANLVGDLADSSTLPHEMYDCLVVTQVLHLIHDPRLAIATLHQLLKPGGVALVTVPGISQVEWAETWHWGFTLLWADAAFARVFGRENVHVRSYGNVLAGTAFLWGLSVAELTTEELDYFDPDYQVIVAVRAVRRSDTLRAVE